MALQCGIVGLPNVGKSTLFNCLSNAKAQAANFPFCTIEPNVGVKMCIRDRSGGRAVVTAALRGGAGRQDKGGEAHRQKPHVEF